MDAYSPNAMFNAISEIDGEESHAILTTEERSTVSGDGEPGDGGLVISCDDCAMQHTSTCDDCMVSFILNREPGDAVVIDADEARALRMLTRVGLVPKPRHVQRVG
jgi:hypothetical protein